MVGLYCYIDVRTNTSKLQLFAYPNSTKFSEKAIRGYMDISKD